MSGTARFAWWMRAPMLLAGVGTVLVAGFFSLRSVTEGMRVEFRPPWDRLTTSEAWYWLGACFLLLPGATMLGVATASRWAQAWAALTRRLEALTPRDRTWSFVLAAVTATAVARIFNATVFQGLPFTDDEYAALFGGQVWAQGHLGVPLPPWIAAAPQLFLFSRDGLLTSFDFPGVVAAWAISAFTRTGTLVFSLLAGISVGGLLIAAARQGGARSAAIAAGLAFASPQFALLSASSHGQLVSRGLLAACFASILFVPKPGAARGVAAGALLGLAFLARPIEIALVAGPWAVGLVIDEARSGRQRFVFAFGGALVALALLFEALNWAVGHSWLPTRLVPNAIVHPYLDFYRANFDLGAWVDRFGNNVMYNFVSAGVLLLGPLGLALAALGATADSTHRRLLFGCVAAFGLGLLHDDRGIHALGPVHVSEASWVLLLLVVGGLRRSAEWLSRVGLRTSFLGGFAGYSLGLVVFTAGYARAIASQASTQAAIYALVDDVAEGPAVLLAPPYTRVFVAADASHIGSWIFSWRRVSPSADEKVVVLHDSPEARAHVAQWFPDRPVLVLTQTHSGARAVPLGNASPVDSVRGMWVEPLSAPR